MQIFLKTLIINILCVWIDAALLELQAVLCCLFQMGLDRKAVMKVALSYNSVSGRGLVATRDILPGELILEESPALYGPKVRVWDHITMLVPNTLCGNLLLEWRCILLKELVCKFKLSVCSEGKQCKIIIAVLTVCLSLIPCTSFVGRGGNVMVAGNVVFSG